MSEHSTGMKIFVWVAVITLLVTAVAPLFFVFAPQSGVEEEVVEEILKDGKEVFPHSDLADEENGLDLDE